VNVTGDGIKIGNATVNSETELTVKLTIAPGAKPGTRELTVTAAGGSSNPLNLHITANQ